MKDDDRDPTLCREFVRQAKTALSTISGIQHEWSIDQDEDHCILNFPKKNENGFDITLEVSSREITISAEAAHMHLELSNNAEETSVNALAILRDMLSEDMRIKEYISNGKPYRWDIQVIQNGKWITEESNGLLFWNYFGKKEIRYLSNRLLPGRLKNAQTRKD